MSLATCEKKLFSFWFYSWCSCTFSLVATGNDMMGGVMWIYGDGSGSVDIALLMPDEGTFSHKKPQHQAETWTCLTIEQCSTVFRSISGPDNLMVLMLYIYFPAFYAQDCSCVLVCTWAHFVQIGWSTLDTPELLLCWSLRHTVREVSLVAKLSTKHWLLLPLGLGARAERHFLERFH